MKGRETAPSAAQRIARALVDRGLIREDQLAEASEVVSTTLGSGQGPIPTAEGRPRPRLAEIGGYAGAALVVAAAGLFLSRSWAELSPTARSLILAGIALALLLAAAGIAFFAGPSHNLRTGHAEVRRRLTGTLMVAAAGAAGFATATWVLHQQRPGRVNPAPTDNLPLIAGLSVALVLLVIGYAIAPLLLTHVVIAGVSMTLVLNLTAELIDARTPRAWTNALVLIAIGLGWLLLSETGVLREQTAGRLIGSALAVVGAQNLLELDTMWPAYTLTFLLTIGLFAAYWWRAEWPYLAVAVVGLTVAVTEAVMDWTDGSLGAGGGVLAAGLTLLAASGAAFVVRSRRERRAL